MKVLILTCNTGGGHTSCAHYIASELKENHIECDVVNYLELIGEHAARIVEKLYLDSTKGWGTVFKGVYKIGEIYNKSNIKSPVYLLNKAAKEKLGKFIKDHKYTLVICTHLFPSMAITEIKKEEEDLKLINVATDYECIPFWNETNPDTFVIPSAKLNNAFINKGFDKYVLLPIGIPVASHFKEKKDSLHLPKDYVLITSGSMGFGHMKELITSILTQVKDYPIVVICGNNKKLEEELAMIENPNLTVVGYTKDMAEYIQKSKIVVTKPGGLTTSEVATIHKPLIHMMPIPGVENYNATFFEENGMSIKANSIEEVTTCITKLLNDLVLQKEMIKNQKEIINENSASQLVQFIKEKY